MRVGTLGLFVSQSHRHLSPLLLQLWKSDDFGQTWIMIQEHVKSFSWYVLHPAPACSHCSPLALFAACENQRSGYQGVFQPSPCTAGMWQGDK